MAQRQAADPAGTVDDQTLVRPFVRGLGPVGPPAHPAGPAPDAGAIAAALAGSPHPAAAGPGAPAGPAAGADRGAAGRRTGRRRALAVGLLLAALAAGAAVLLRPAPGRPSAAPPQVTAPVTAVPASPAAGTPAAGGTPTTRTAGAPAPAGSRTPAAAAPTATAGPSAGRSSAPGTLRPGDSGAAVLRLQHLLFGQGKTYVEATGRYDDATERAVREVQRERSITADPPGVYGPATRAALEGS